MSYKAVGYAKNATPCEIIDEQYYHQIKNAKAVCLFAVDLEEKLSLLLDNFFEFETELLRLAEISLIWPHGDHEDAMTQRLTLDRRLANLLTACKLYLDQTDHGLSQLYGSSSPELATIKSFKNELYESCWGYRFMEALRSHVQHSGLPVHSIIYRSEGIDSICVGRRVIPKASLQTLRENKKFKRSILDELEQRGSSHVDLRGPTREYLSCLVRLHGKLRDLIATKVSTARGRYVEAVKRFTIIEGHSVELPRLVQSDDIDGTTIDEVQLVTEFLDYLDSLQKRNRVQPDFSRFFASNSDQK